VHLQIHPITASKCICEFTPFPGLQVDLQTRSIPASRCISEFTRSQCRGASPNMLDHALQVHLQGATAGVRRYSGNEGGHSDRVSIFGRPRSTLISSHFHLNISYNDNTHSIFRNFWSDSLCPRFHPSTQLRGSSTPGSIISCHQIPTLIEPERLLLMNDIWLSRVVRRSVGGGLSAFSLHHFATMASKWCISKSSLNGRVQVLLILCSSTICS